MRDPLFEDRRHAGLYDVFDDDRSGLDPTPRPWEELTADVEQASFDVVDVCDAPDRPGLEHVLTCRRR